ncbi:MAG: ribosome maturation factor RimP [Oscillospiraceae bacterium]|nr:ribosome maturation factor RimP [Oscillospiraceae bacterium]
MANKKNTVEIVLDIIKPVADEMNLKIWDVRFEKEGPNWFLKIFIDKEKGVDINDCENFSRKIDPILDEVDPIEQSYYLEVSSPGVERELIKDWHIKKYIGQDVNIKFIRPINNIKEIVARLVSFEDNIITIILKDGSQLSFDKKEAAIIKLNFDFNK